MFSSIEELRARMAQGWTFQEATMGRDWQAKYPHIAGWRGVYSLAGSPGRWRIGLEAYCHCEWPAFHSTRYKLVEVESLELDEYQSLDATIAKWSQEHGENGIARLEKGWMHQEGWKSRYPSIAGWIERGKRHCILIEFDWSTFNLPSKRGYTTNRRTRKRCSSSANCEMSAKPKRWKHWTRASQIGLPSNKVFDRKPFVWNSNFAFVLP